jgi:hypothetical protein
MCLCWLSLATSSPTHIFLYITRRPTLSSPMHASTPKPSLHRLLCLHKSSTTMPPCANRRSASLAPPTMMSSHSVPFHGGSPSGHYTGTQGFTMWIGRPTLLMVGAITNASATLMNRPSGWPLPTRQYRATWRCFPNFSDVVKSDEDLYEHRLEEMPLLVGTLSRPRIPSALKSTILRWDKGN